MEKKNEEKVDKRGNAITEIETLTELIDRERASVRILLIAASGDSVDSDDVCLLMRDCFDRVEKMETSINRLQGFVR